MEMKDKILLNCFANFEHMRVLVIGDVMLDEYVWGEVSRISPEAPVPIVNILRRTYCPGGAGNVAANIAALGGTPLLGAVAGEDPAALQLIQALRESNVRDSSGLGKQPGRVTTSKTRIVAHSQQMLRLDTETDQVIHEQFENALVDWCAGHIPVASVCVLSDYAKGTLTNRVCQRVIELARNYNLPIIVDPKGRDFSKYAGATLITPNRHEVIVATDAWCDSACDFNARAQRLLNQIGNSHLLVTQGAQGMSLYRRDLPRLDIPAAARKVYDVTGAGDTAVATLALALGAGAPLEQAVNLANLTAGLVVGKLGTATVSREELAEVLNA